MSKLVGVVDMGMLMDELFSLLRLVGRTSGQALFNAGIEF